LRRRWHRLARCDPVSVHRHEVDNPTTPRYPLRHRNIQEVPGILSLFADGVANRMLERSLNTSELGERRPRANESFFGGETGRALLACLRQNVARGITHTK
jgi:hypothetical protein